MVHAAGQAVGCPLLFVYSLSVVVVVVYRLILEGPGFVLSSLFSSFPGLLWEHRLTTRMTKNLSVYTSTCSMVRACVCMCMHACVCMFVCVTCMHACVYGCACLRACIKKTLSKPHQQGLPKHVCAEISQSEVSYSENFHLQSSFFLILIFVFLLNLPLFRLKQQIKTLFTIYFATKFTEGVLSTI